MTCWRIFDIKFRTILRSALCVNFIKPRHIALDKYEFDTFGISHVLKCNSYAIFLPEIYAELSRITLKSLRYRNNGSNNIV